MEYKSVLKKVPIEDVWMYHEFSFGLNHRRGSMFYTILKADVERNGMINPLLCIEKVRDVKKMCEDEEFNRNYQQHLKDKKDGKPIRDWVRGDGAPIQLVGGTEPIHDKNKHPDRHNKMLDAGGNNRFLVALELGYKEVEIRILPDIEPATINYWQTKGLEPTNVDHILGLY